jgi:hypothetical protein
MNLTCRAALVVALAAALPACTDEPSDLDRCRARRPTIQQGVYGCTRETYDVSGTQTEVDAHPHFELRIAADAAGHETLATTISSEIGFYEVPLDVGRVWICALRCQELDIQAGALERWEWENSFTGRWER